MSLSKSTSGRSSDSEWMTEDVENQTVVSISKPPGLMRNGTQENQTVILEGCDKLSASATPGEKAKWRDLVGFFICGIFADALPGFFFSATLIKAMEIPNDTTAIMALSADVGGVVGGLTAAFILRRFMPDARVLANSILQATGLLLSWVLSYPGNMVGVSILTVGFQGMLATILPLTAYKPEKVMRSYQFGFAGAPVLGIAVVKFGKAVGLSSDGLFAIAICMPVLVSLVYFLVIDRSSFSSENAHQDEKDNSHDAIANSTATADYGLSKLTRFDMILAVKEIFLTYMPTWIIAIAAQTFFVDAAANYFYSSSATHGGQDPEMAADSIVLAAHTSVFLVGFLAMIPRLSHVSRLVLWIPDTVLVALVTIALLGLNGHFAPISVGGAYAVAIGVFVTQFYVTLFTPLIMRRDASDGSAITTRYLEFQIQTLMIVSNVVRLIVDIISAFWAASKVLESCKESYENVYEGVSCTL